MFEAYVLEEERERAERWLATPVRDLEDLAVNRVLTQVNYEQNDAARSELKGQYGFCTRCGKPIDPDRLEAVPWTTLCMSCADADNRSRRHGHASRSER